jgi:imidazolonepropionase-like amidohydrolase
MHLPLSCAVRRLRHVLAVAVAVTAACTPATRPTSSSAGAVLQAAGSPVPRAPAGVTAFVDVNVIPMDTERMLSHQTVLVEGGRITALGPSTKVLVPAGATRIEGHGKFLMPGLADMHAHIANTYSEPEVYDTAKIESELRQLVARGITTIRNVNPHSSKGSATLLRFRARAAAGELVSPRIYTAGSLWGSSYGSADMQRLRPEEIAGYVTALQAAGYDFIKPYFENAEVFDSVAAAARRVGIPLMGHVPFAVTVERALAVGMRSIEHLEGYFRYDATQRRYLPPDTTQIPALVAATRRAGAWNCPTLHVFERGYELARRDSTKLRKWEAEMLLRRRFVKALQDGGAGLLLGTDLTILNTPIHHELAALVRAGLTPYQALATGTKNVAIFFGTLAESGTVAVGKRADLVLLTGNPLEDVAATKALAGVMLGGRWLE